MIAQRTIDEILERASLYEIVAEGVSLKRQGTSVVGLCPFHAEKSPSFHLRDDRFYHCFGCGVSGNAISFVMRARGLGFPEAVEELAGRLGIKVDYEGVRKPQGDGADKNALYAANSMAARFFSSCLEAGSSKNAPESVRIAAGRVQAYLEERRISAEAQKAFNIGFAPPERSALHSFLKQKKITEPIMLQAGLIRRSQRGDLYDTFRARLIFPIATDSKHIAGFGGRLIPSLVEEGTLTKAPKYLNSSDTPVYHKQAVFFGLPQALAAIRESREVYLVEGYLDVVGLWQVGVRTALATCGTAVTTQHVRRLKHLTRKVTLLFDGDSAGRAAAGKSYPLFVNSGLDVCAAFLPSDQDPDTFALAHGAETSAKLSELPRVPLIECYIDLQVEKAGASSASELGGASKGRLCEELVPILREVGNPIEQSELIERASLKLSVDSTLLREMVTAKSSASTRSSSIRASSGSETQERSSSENRDDVVSAPSPISELPRLDRELLFALMAHKEDLPRELLSDPDLSTQVNRSTLRFAEELCAIMAEQSIGPDQKKEALKDLLDLFGDSWREHWKQAYAMSTDKEVDFSNIFVECKRAYAKASGNLQLKELDRLARAATTDEERMSLSQQSVTLKRHLTKL